MFLELMLVASGVVIASVATAVGIGSGILWTPLLILVYGLSPQESVATSLLIQVVGMGSGAAAYYRTGLVRVRLSLLFYIVALPGVIIGSFISFRLSQQAMQMALGVMSMVLAILFVAGRDEIAKSSSGRYQRDQVVRILPIPAFFGVIMGSLSLGIGEWLIPALRNRLHLDMSTSIATVIPMMFMLALSASLIHGYTGIMINWKCFILGAVGTLIGGQIGVQISRRINEQVLKQGFIYLMTLIGIHLIFQAI